MRKRVSIMLFPDCRNDEYYNQRFLDGVDKNLVRGYDFGSETVDNFFDNPEFINDDNVMQFFDKELPEDMFDEYETCFADADGHIEKRKVKTYGDYIRMRLLVWLEMQRDEFITALIDTMDDDLYDAIRNKFMKENPDKEFYDTRKFMTTCEK